MKKTRILLSFMLAGMLSLSMLTACGGNDSSKSTDTEKSKASQTADESKEDSVSTGETEEDSKPTGETFDMDTFIVLVPSGWVAMDFKDMHQIKLFKTDDVNNTFGVPEVDITYKANVKYNLYTAIFESYEEISPITTGSYTWNGVQGKYDKTTDLILLNTAVGEGHIAADIWIKTSSETAISIEDADVNAILSSITIK